MEYVDKTFDEERALYGIDSAVVDSCSFKGPRDGESALKECKNITVKNCFFDLRYPFWHNDNLIINNTEMTENCRAALWYDNNLKIYGSKLNGIKAVRECRNVAIEGCSISSVEFGWKSNNIKISNSSLISEYPFLNSNNIKIEKLNMKAKYSFQYVTDMTIRNSVFDTKDAFWHSKNVTVYDSVIKGEYLAWYSENLHLIRCKIIGTQPLCYCKNLIMEDCEMEDTDLSFEYSDVKADIKGNIISVKNPCNGYIKADSIGEVIMDEYKKKNTYCDIKIKESTLK